MRRSENKNDLGKMTDRIMINIFKKKFHEVKLDPKRLRGSWEEAKELLHSLFVKVSRIMVCNQYKLQVLPDSP